MVREKEGENSELLLLVEEMNARVEESSRGVEEETAEMTDRRSENGENGAYYLHKQIDDCLVSSDPYPLSSVLYLKTINHHNVKSTSGAV